MCDWGKDKSKEKEIERVQGPPEKARDESVALYTAQRFEQTQRFHVGQLIVISNEVETSLNSKDSLTGV